MSVTVKVLLRLAFFLAAFLDHGIAKHHRDSEFDVQYDRHTRYLEDPYSEFTDDAPDHREDLTIQSSKERNPDRPEDEVEDLRDKKKYDKEQYWNQDDVEVEDESLHPAESRNRYDSKEVARNSRQTKNRKFDDSSSDESGNYEVYEIVDDDDGEPETSETRIVSQAPKTRPPDKFVYKGVQYVRAPEPSATKKLYVKHGQGQNDEHYHRVQGTAGSPPASRYSSRDSDSAESGKARGNHHTSGGERDHKSKHHSANGHKDDKGHKSSHYNEKGAKGREGHEKHSKHYDEQGGKKQSDLDSANHYGEHQEAAEGQKAGKFDEKKAHKKGHNTKGYHNKYHKDEYHKEHKFYDDYQKSGSHSRFGDFQSKHGSKEGGLKKNYHLDQASHEDQAGKKGHHAKGHVDEDHKSHKNDKGYDKHHAQHSDYGKKGGHQGGKSYAYETKH